MRTQLITTLFLFVSILGLAQRRQINCLGDTVKYLSIGREHKGIGLGNPSKYSGVRLSVVDKNCITNGVTFNLFSDVNSRKTNGLDVGFSQSAGSVNGVSIGLLGNNIDYELRGFGFGTILSEGLNIYGVSLTGGFQRADKFHGLCIAGLMYRSFETKGLIVSGLVLQNDSVYSGVAITGGLSKMTILKGLSIAIANWSDEVKGIQLGLINKTNYMKGIQFGLINIITENPKWARVFPLINMSFKTKPINIDLEIDVDLLAINQCKNGTLDYETASSLTVNDTIKRELGSLSILSEDSLILSFVKPFNMNSIEVYLDDKMVYPVKGNVMDTTSHPMEQFVKIRKAELNYLKVVNKKGHKCMEANWKPKYAILRFSYPNEDSDHLLMTYTNDFIPAEGAK